MRQIFRGKAERVLLEKLDSAFANLIDGVRNSDSIRANIRKTDYVFVGEYPLPRNFVVTLNFLTLVSREKLLWTCKLHMEVSSESYPRAIEVTIGRVAHSEKSRIAIARKTRVEKEHVGAVARDLRHLEAYAVALMANTLGVVETEDGDLYWYERAKAQEDFDDSPQDWARLQQSVLKRTRNQKWDDEFLKEVADIYRQSKREGINTNVAIAEIIGARRNEKIPTKTVQKWVKAARDAKLLEPAPPKANSSPSKAGKVTPKKTTTRGNK